MDQIEHAMKTSHHRKLRLPNLLGLAAAALLAALMTGCWQRSVHPFHTEADVVPEPALAGAWRQVADDPATDKPAEDRMSWTFTVIDATRYQLVIAGDRDQYEYEARVFRLGTEGRFLDLYSKTRRVDTIPAHHLFRLLDTGRTLKVSALSTEWMAHWLRDHPKSLAHARVTATDQEDEFVLTAETAVLQRFVREHLRDDGFFTDPLVFEKEGAKARDRR